MVMNLQYFGGRGGSSGIGRNSIGISNRIKKEMLDSGLKSKFKGVQRDAQNGTGNYSYKDAKAVVGAEALKMDVYEVHIVTGKQIGRAHV